MIDFIVIYSLKKHMNINRKIGIIGGSIAGTSLAVRLLSLGHDVILFEKDSFPREKICGEGLSNLGLLELAKLNLKNSILSLPHVKLKGFLFEEQKSLDFSTNNNIENHFGIGIQRLFLDDLLYNSLPEDYKKFNCKIDKINSLKEGFLIETNDKEQYFVKYLVLADGSYSSSSKKLKVPTKIKRIDRVGVSCKVLIAESVNNFVSVNSADNYDSCLTPVDTNIYNLSIMCNSKTLKEYTSINKLIEATLIKHKVNKFIEYKNILTVSNISKFKRSSFYKNIFTVGDTYQQLDPIGGMGMSNALITSRVVAETINKILLQGYSEKLIKEHESLMKKETRITRAFTLTSKMASNSLLLRKLRSSSLSKKICTRVHQVYTPIASSEFAKQSKFNMSYQYSIISVFLKFLSFFES